MPDTPRSATRAARACFPVRWPLLLLIATSVTQMGCAGFRWHGLHFESVHADARRDNRLTFVFLRNWYMVECTEFEEHVLNTQPVRDLLADTYCVKIEYDRSEPLIKRWNVGEPPAFVIVDPKGEVVARNGAARTLDAAVEAIRQAKNRFAQSTQPGAPP